MLTTNYIGSLFSNKMDHLTFVEETRFHKITTQSDVNNFYLLRTELRSLDTFCRSSSRASQREPSNVVLERTTRGNRINKIIQL